MIKISILARDLGIHRNTLYTWHEEGKIEFVKVNKLNYVTRETYNRLMNIREEKKEEKIIIYCRVSTSARKNNLETQKDRLINFANARGYKVHKVYTEIGSGFNDNRKRLQKILDDQDFTILLVEHKDRLTRVGFNYLETLLNKLGKKIEVVNSVDTDEKDIIQDFISIITSYTARIYGKRRTKRKTEELIKELKRKSKEDDI
jgi:predicted site-specific integrase-resolvase